MRVPENYLIAGEVYDVTVAAVKERCIVVSIDGTEYTDIIHISNISSKFITNLAEYAYVGMNLKAKAVKWNGKVELSVKALESETDHSRPVHKYQKRDGKSQPRQSSANSDAKGKKQSSDFDKMLASCEASFKDKMRDRNVGGMALKRGRFTRTRNSRKSGGRNDE